LPDHDALDEDWSKRATDIYNDVAEWLKMETDALNKKLLQLQGPTNQ